MFKRKPILGGGNFVYTQSRYISKKGSDLIPGDVPVPVGDELQCTLFKNGSYTLVAMCIYEKIMWIIPWHYNEYIIWMKNEDIDFDKCTAEDIIKWMDEAVHWNQRGIMKPDDRYKGGNFNFIKYPEYITTHSYSVDGGDYTFLKMNNIDSIYFDRKGEFK